ncbi:TPA: hypothetical protein ACVO1C_003520 [Vibrio diabolicus]
MQIQKIHLNHNSYYIPDTESLRASDFNVISHSIIKNVSERDVLKFGTFASDVNFAHDDSFQVVKGRDMRGGIDTRLSCISNFHKNSKSLSRLRDAIDRNQKLSPYERESQNKWLKNTQQYFREILQERKTQRKLPTYYTAALKHKKTRRFMKNAAFLIVENNDETQHLFARIGNTEYDFQFSMTEVDVKSGKQLRCDYSIYDASTIGETDDLLLDDIELECDTRSKLAQDNIEHSDLALKEVLDSLDAEYAVH